MCPSATRLALARPCVRSPRDITQDHASTKAATLHRPTERRAHACCWLPPLQQQLSSTCRGNGSRSHGQSNAVQSISMKLLRGALFGLVLLATVAVAVAQEAYGGQGDYGDDYGQQPDSLYHDYAARQEGKGVGKQ